jgi:hypothetical protein
MKYYQIPLFLILAILGFGCKMHSSVLKITLLPSKPNGPIVASYEGFDRGGNTSIAHDNANSYKWSGESPYDHEPWGYFDASGNEIPYIKRDRDLGQTFRYTGNKAARLEAITLRTGLGSNVVRPGMYGQNISLQIFEVSGQAVLHNNGSDESMEAFHGFPHNRLADSIPSMRDDYFTGEIYTSLAVIRGGRFPQKGDFGFSTSDTVIAPADEKLKGRYLQFAIPQKQAVVLQPGRQYAFLVMIDQMGEERGFTLANNFYGSYQDGHGIRRDGRGIFPPPQADPMKDFTDPANTKALESAHFPSNFNERVSIPPGTNGYPDVCTWRDLVFYIQAR